MIQLEKLKIYDKSGSDLQLTPTSLLELHLESEVGVGAIIYPYLSHNNSITGFYIVDGGYGYGSYDSLETNIDGSTIINGMYHNVTNCYITSDGEKIGEVPVENIMFGAINYTDSRGTHKSLYVKEISSYNISLDYNKLFEKNISFPSLTFTSSIFTNKISTNLIETEHLHIFYKEGDSLATLYDDEYSKIMVNTSDGDSEIKLFEVDNYNNIIHWCESLECDINTQMTSNISPLSFNIGFMAENEGVFENILNLYYYVNNKSYLICEIIVNSESIGEDERFRTLLGNFGVQDPKNFMNIIKNYDINEYNIDNELLNQKSKEFFLEHDNIFKFCGTYKGLINAVKILGYDDIHFREWFFDTKTSKTKTFNVSYGSTDKEYLHLPLLERKALKKLNSLSMVYALNKETGEYDKNGIPLVENVYQNNLAEVRVKLLALKNWLEKNIIGVNCRITDISAEGVYFTSYNNTINGVVNLSTEISESINLTPYIKDNGNDDNDYYIVNFKEDKANLRLSVLEASNFTLTNDIKNLTANDLKTSTALSPLYKISDFMWRAQVSTKSTILPLSVATNGLWIYNNTLKIVNNLTNNNVGDNDCQFICQYVEDDVVKGNRINVILEHAYLRDINSNEIIYKIVINKTLIQDDVRKLNVDVNSGGVTITDDTIEKYEYKYELHDLNDNVILSSNSYIFLKMDTKSSLKYGYNNTIKGLSLFIKNPYITLQDGTYLELDKEYVLEIIDGKISIEPMGQSVNNITTYINFNYDVISKEQIIECNHVYTSPRLSAINNGITSVEYDMDVYHIGNYSIELITWNKSNNIFLNSCKKNCDVIKHKPTYNTFVNSETKFSDELNHYIDYIDEKPIYETPITYSVDKIIEGNGEYSLITKSLSYVNKLPYKGAYVNILDKRLSDKDKYEFICDVNNIISDESFTKIITLDHSRIDIQIGDVVSLEVIIHEHEKPNNVIFSASISKRVEYIDEYNYIYFNGRIFPDYIYYYFSPSVDMCRVKIKPAWYNVDNIDTFRIEDSTEFEFDGNKLILDFKNDNYILPYIDRFFEIYVEDFNVSKVNEKWIKASNIKNIYPSSVFDIDNNEVILIPDDMNNDNIYIWTVYNKDGLYYRIFNKIPSFVYDKDKVYNIRLECVDKYGNLTLEDRDGVIKIKEVE